MTTIVILLVIVIVMLYLILGILTLWVICFSHLGFDTSVAKKQMFIKNCLTPAIVFWPIHLLASTLLEPEWDQEASIKKNDQNNQKSS